MKETPLTLLNSACGLTHPWTLSVRQGEHSKPTLWTFDQPFIVAGRARGADLRLRHRDVSWRHAYLQLIDGQLFYIDLQSRTGLFHHNQLKPMGWLPLGEDVQLGPYQLSAKLPQSENSYDLKAYNPLSNQFQTSKPMPTIRMEFSNGRILENPATSQSWQIDRNLTLVGQHQLCKVRFFHPSVSTFHCSLLRTPKGIFVIDLLGRDGIVVNGQQVRCALLHDGDILEVGRFRILIHAIAPMENPQKPAQQSQPFSPSTSAMSFSLDALETEENNTPVPTAVVEVASALSSPSRQTSRAENSRLTARRHEEAPSSIMNIPTPPGANDPDEIADPLPRKAIHGEDLMPPMQLPTNIPYPVAPAQGSLPANRETVEAILMPFMGQFSQMQKQMFDQFQQTIMIMAQMFSSVHRDQMSFIREELDRLQELTSELTDLQAELAQYKQNGPGEVPSQTGKSRPTAATGQAKSPSGTPFSSEFPANVPGMQTPNSSGGVRPSPAREYAAKTAASGPPENTASTPPSGDVHDWLCKRFDSLQQERQSRWQRLFNTLLGKQDEQANTKS